MRVISAVLLATDPSAVSTTKGTDTKTSSAPTTISTIPTATIRNKKPISTTWIIDGNNLLGQRRTPRDANVLIEKIKPVASYGDDSIMLVFDGKKGITDRIDKEIDIDSSVENEENDESDNNNKKNNHYHNLLRLVQLEEGMTADDYILDTIKLLHDESKLNRVKLVTADKMLRKSSLTNNRPTVKSVINPKTFWLKYVPRMAGHKTTYENNNNNDNDDDDDENQNDQIDIDNNEWIKWYMKKIYSQ